MNRGRTNYCEQIFTTDVIGLKYSYMKCTCVDKKREECKYFHPSKGSSEGHMYCWYFTYEDHPECQHPTAREEAMVLKKLEDI